MGRTLTWEKGRQLKAFGSNTYTYNANGIRTGKTVGGVVHSYILDGARIQRETWDGNTLVPLYDNEDDVCGVLYNGVAYYFQKNLQGDVIAIADQNAETVARYTYDAWGVCTVTADTSGVDIAAVNPFRYRSYYYDTETGLYYLQSRYYDPVVGRFLNADAAELVTIGSALLIKNLYSYCCNNPVNETDQGGNLIVSVLKKILAGALKGLFKQFCIDIIEWAFKQFVLNSHPAFKLSRVEDYISSVFSAIFDEFKLSNIVGIAVSIVALLIKYIPKFIWGGMKRNDWLNLLMDVVAIIVTELMRKSINQLNGKRMQIKKMRKKSSKNTAIKIQVSTLNLKIKHKGIAINIILPISQQLISSALNILC